MLIGMACVLGPVKYYYWGDLCLETYCGPKCEGYFWGRVQGFVLWTVWKYSSMNGIRHRYS